MICALVYIQITCLEGQILALPKTRYYDTDDQMSPTLFSCFAFHRTGTPESMQAEPRSRSVGIQMVNNRSSFLKVLERANNRGYLVSLPANSFLAETRFPQAYPCTDCQSDIEQKLCARAVYALFRYLGRLRLPW